MYRDFVSKPRIDAWTMLDLWAVKCKCEGAWAILYNKRRFRFTSIDFVENLGLRSRGSIVIILFV
jgi:hypothetical protein